MKTKSHKFNLSLLARAKAGKIVISAAVMAGIFVVNAGTVFASDITPANVEYLVNSERTYYGLPPLKVDPKLNSAAALKTKDMITRNYFEHFAFGLTPWDFIKQSDYNYLYAGENLAMNFQTSEGMVNAWMQSPLHRANILNPDYTDMGIGVVKGAFTENGQLEDTIIVDNMFGRRKPAILEVFNKFIAKIAEMYKF